MTAALLVSSSLPAFGSSPQEQAVMPVVAEGYEHAKLLDKKLLNRMADNVELNVVSSTMTPEGKVLVSGITDGEYVSAYNAAGILVQRLPVTENHVWFKLQKGFYLFNIHYANDTDKALKAIVP